MSCTKKCPHRYAYRRADEPGKDMKRAVYLCSKRVGGFMLKHWKCVGLNNPGCPILSQNTLL